MKKMIMAALLAAGILINSVTMFAAGSNVMPGGYSEPPQKASDRVNEMLNNLLKQRDSGQLEEQPAGEASVLVNKFILEGDDPLNLDVNEILKDSIGKKLTIGQLNGLADNLTKYYRQNNYPVAVVYLPKQQIKDRAVKFAVLIGKYGKIIVTNSSTVSETAIRHQAYAISEGGYITTSGLEKALLLINDLPLADARAEMAPGKERGTADLKINVYPDSGKRYGGNAGLDNYGSQYTGLYEIGLNGYANNITANGDTLAISAQAGYQPDDKNFDTWNGALSYRIPSALFSGDAGAGVAYVNYVLGGIYNNLNYRGNSLIETLNWNYVLQRSQKANQFLQARMNCKQLQDQQVSVGAWSNSNVLEWSLNYGGNVSGWYGYNGYTAYNVGVTAGSWWLNSNTTNQQYQLNSTPGFVFGSAEAYHQARFSDLWSADIDVSGQLAGNVLNPTDKFTLGGYYGVKAYAPGYAAGDNGLLGKLNVRYNIPWQPAVWWPGLQAIAFTDAGIVRVTAIDSIPGSANTQSIGDYGLGLAVYAGTQFSAEVDYAWKMYYWDSAGGSSNDQGSGNDSWLVRLNYKF